MAHAEEDSVILTIQAHKNTVAVASLVGCRALLVCSSRPVPADMLEAAKQERVGVYRTPMNQFAASIAVHQLLSSS